MTTAALTRRTAIAGAALLPFRPARSQPIERLYTAIAIVTGYDMRSRPAGFAQCLREVLVKLTGDPSVAVDPNVPADAGPYVAAFTYFDPIAHRRPHDDQGSYDRSYDLSVRFDRAKTDALVTMLGRRLWADERPAVLPVIRMSGTSRPWVVDFTVTEDDPAAAGPRTALSNAGTRYGLDISFPSAVLADALRQSIDGPDPDTMTHPAAMLVVGDLRWTPDDLGWSGGWRARWRRRRYAGEVRGVGFDVAFDRLVRGALQVASGTGSFE